MSCLAWLRSLVACSFVVLAACGPGPAAHEAMDPDIVGAVWFQLSARAESGQVYRLEGATFDVSGPTREQLTNRDDTDALHVRLPAGEYSVHLLPGWKLVRAEDGKVLNAVLRSQNPATASITPRATTKMLFEFDLADGEEVGFGDLGIGIAVNEPEPGDDEDPVDDQDPVVDEDGRDPPPDSDEAADSDADGVRDLDDNCPTNANQNQKDKDGDGVGDACDGCPRDASSHDAAHCLDDGRDGDLDGDGVLDAVDNCRTVANAGQADGDADAVGNACDNCPTHANAAQSDANGDGFGDACQCEADGRCN